MEVSISILLLAIINGALSYECGKENLNYRYYTSPVRVLQANRFPWVANIRINEEEKQSSQCAGALITDQNIVTVASCLTKDGKLIDISKIKVRLGSAYAFSDPNPPFKVKSVRLDDKFDHKSYSNNFAVLTLEQKVKFSWAIAPVCLPKSDEAFDFFTRADWGRNKKNGILSDEIMYTDEAIITRQRCRRLKGISEAIASSVDIKAVDWFMNENKLRPIAGNEFCAKSSKNITTVTCPGDGGAPIMRKDSNSEWVLVGLASQSWECTDSEYNGGIYTRITSYQDLIREVAPNSTWVNVKVYGK